MTDFQYCRCTNPDYFTSGAKRYCRHCWHQPPPPAEPEPPVYLPPLDVLGEWVAHSVSMGMDAPRIAADLRISVGVIQIVMNGGV